MLDNMQVNNLKKDQLAEAFAVLLTLLLLFPKYLMFRSLQHYIIWH